MIRPRLGPRAARARARHRSSAPRRPPAAGVILAALALLAAPVAALAHSSSKAQALLQVEGPRVDIRVDLLETDTLELFDVDAASPKERPRLARVLETSVPGWISLHADGARCTVRFLDEQPRASRTVRIRAEALCPAPPASLRIDWGLSTLTSLDVATLATITAPHDVRHVVVFRKASPRVDLALARPSALDALARFGAMGVTHILGGWDHLLFLLALLLGCATLGRLALVVTSFTLAHSVTLALGATGVVRVPAAVVEPVIALSIAAAALAGAIRFGRGRLAWPGSGSATAPPLWEAGLALGFGLVHGFGFAGMLLDALADLPPGGSLIAPLLGFNIGVELGQAAVVAVLFPVAVRGLSGGRARKALPVLFAALAAAGMFAFALRVLEG